MPHTSLKLVVPKSDNGTDHSRTVPNRIANDKLRSREYLTEAEVSLLEKAATKLNRNGFRLTKCHATGSGSTWIVR